MQPHVGALRIGIDHHLLVIAAQAHRVDIIAHFQRADQLDHTAGIRAAINIIAQVDNLDRLVGMAGFMACENLFMQCLQAICLAVHVSDGVDDCIVHGSSSAPEMCRSDERHKTYAFQAAAGMKEKLERALC